jgi:hypothetical protein
VESAFRIGRNRTLSKPYSSSSRHFSYLKDQALTAARRKPGPDKGYGFGSSGTPNRSVEEHRESIRAFLAMIDPDTGYIGDY